MSVRVHIHVLFCLAMDEIIVRDLKSTLSWSSLKIIDHIRLWKALNQSYGCNFHINVLVNLNKVCVYS